MLEKRRVSGTVSSSCVIRRHSSLGSSYPLQGERGGEPKLPGAVLGPGCVPGYPAPCCTRGWALTLARPMRTQSDHVLRRGLSPSLPMFPRDTRPCHKLAPLGTQRCWHNRLSLQQARVPQSTRGCARPPVNCRGGSWPHASDFATKVSPSWHAATQHPTLPRLPQ